MLTADAFYSAPVKAITPVVETRFFSSLKTGNRTFRTTGCGRLREVDSILTSELAAVDARIETALDIGISSGITTLEFIDALGNAGFSPAFVGTDRSVAAKLVDLPYGCRALVEPNGHVLQFELLGRPFRPWIRRLDYVTGMALVRWGVTRALRKPTADCAQKGECVRNVSLITPRLSSRCSVNVVEDDITRRNPAFTGRFDLVRAANILNLHYFSNDDLACAVENVVNYLKGPGSWLLVLRTHGSSSHNGTIFRVGCDGSLHVVRRFGIGSEVEDLFLSRTVRP